jgi:hypothetical protein
VTTVGDSTGFPIWVPDDTTVLVPLRNPFTTLANSIATQFGHLKAQSVSSITFTNKITPASGWTFTTKTTTVTAEIFGTIYMEFHKNSGTLVTGTDGNVSNTKVATLDSGYPPQQPVPLSSGANGRGAFGYLNTAGEVYLTAVAGSADVTSSTGLSLGGTFPLANPISSGL